MNEGASPPPRFTRKWDFKKISRPSFMTWPPRVAALSHIDTPPFPPFPFSLPTSSTTTTSSSTTNSHLTKTNYHKTPHKRAAPQMTPQRQLRPNRKTESVSRQGESDDKMPLRLRRPRHRLICIRLLIGRALGVGSRSRRG